MDYLHGYCHIWVINNFKKGDLILVFQEEDYEIDEVCMAHALLYRNGKYVDVRGEMDDVDEVLEEFACSDDDVLKFKTVKEFKKYLDRMNISY